MATQNAARAHKVEVVDEVKTRMSAATASIVSEYRGLTVAELADLRQALATAGGDYKIFKNTLVRRARSTSPGGRSARAARSDDERSDPSASPPLITRCGLAREKSRSALATALMSPCTKVSALGPLR